MSKIFKGEMNFLTRRFFPDEHIAMFTNKFKHVIAMLYCLHFVICFHLYPTFSPVKCVSKQTKKENQSILASRVLTG